MPAWTKNSMLGRHLFWHIMKQRTEAEAAVGFLVFV